MASSLSPDSSTLTPLPGVVRDGLIAVTSLAFLSLVSTAVLVFYITYRLIKWEYVANLSPAQRESDASGCGQPSMDLSNDLSLGLEERHYVYLKTKTPSPPGSALQTPQLEKENSQPIEKRDTRWNPVLVLVYNLLCANLIEATAFLLSVAWLKDGGIFVPTATCWVQGWCMQVGKLVCSGMLVLISVNTYTTIVRGHKLSRSMIYTLTASVWMVALGLPIGGIVGTRNGVEHGGYYTRAGAWCWVNTEYGSLALWLEYLWIFVAMAVTMFLLAWVVISLYRNDQSARHFPQTIAECMEKRQRNEPPKPSGHHPAFLVYQLIYVFCTAPLAVSRLAGMAGIKSGWVFYGIAGSMIASHGWLNVLLWSTTIIFIGDKDIQETGLEKFAFVRTPQRVYGNMVVVQGGNDPKEARRRTTWWSPTHVLSVASPTIIPQLPRWSGSEQSLRRSRSSDQSVIGVEIEAQVVIEDADDGLTNPRIIVRPGDQFRT